MQTCVSCHGTETNERFLGGILSLAIWQLWQPSSPSGSGFFAELRDISLATVRSAARCTAVLQLNKAQSLLAKVTDPTLLHKALKTNTEQQQKTALLPLRVW